MSTTELYDLETIEYSTTGWNGIVTANMQKMEAHLHSRFKVTLGETVEETDALYIDPDDGLAYKARQCLTGLWDRPLDSQWRAGMPTRKFGCSVSA